MKTRKEHDILGDIEVPYDSYYGSETQRALKNFNISGIHINSEIIRAYAIIKKSAAIANIKNGALDSTIGKPIIKACDEIISNKLSDQFKIDVFQAGAGTNTNMNINEVIANRALELLKKKRGSYNIINPNDHVNMGQSTNDTYHTAMNIALVLLIKNSLLPSIKSLEETLNKKADAFKNIIKVGRTHLQDAVPISLGSEFSGYASSLHDIIGHLNYAIIILSKVPIGGTAIGTGINAKFDYKKNILKEINILTKHKFSGNKNIFSGMQNPTEELLLSGILKTAAIEINKIANDFRLLGSGPRSGISEIVLPAVQPGSSIMPGKINPSIAEMMNMACFHVVGACSAVEWAVGGAQLELNVFMPIISFELISSIKIFSNAIITFDKKCVIGIEPNIAQINAHLKSNLSIVTALTPYIGYQKASEITMRAYKENSSIMDVCMRLHILDKNKLNKILDPKNMV